MHLTLAEAAARLGKSERQVRYMIQKGSLPATKIGGRWTVDSSNLPLSEGQREAMARKEQQLRIAVEEGLGLPASGGRRPRFSVNDLKAFQITLSAHRHAVEHLGSEQPATLALRTVLAELSRGCHRFEHRDKAAAYRAARDAASLAVCELVLLGGEVAEELVKTLEQELMSAMAGLLRRLERKAST